MQVISDTRPHGIENEIDTFSPRKLRCWNEVAVSRNKYDLVDLFLVSQGGNIEADPHVNALLFGVVSHVVFGQV